ncbi:leucine-rich repeat domain-containing protein [Pseudonocardia sp. CA-142604]|uniref:leucine-rich repeat domain-containing protein n=1 Tax=Pseudonocardia sp. CA-142604 TaxID=3240024 RepID=UPI003D8EC5E1
MAVALAPYDLSSRALVVAMACSPLMTTLAASVRSTRAGGVAIVVAGIVIVGVGVATTVSTDALHLFRLDFPFTQVAMNAATVLAPLGLVVVGGVLVVAGLAALLRDRLLGAIAAAITVVTALLYAIALLGLAVQPLAYRGGSVQNAPIVAAAVVGVAALLLVVVATRWWSLPARTNGPRPAAPALASASGRRVARWILVGAIVLVGAGAGWAGYSQLGDRLELAELFPDPALAACVRSAVDDMGSDRVSERELNSVFHLACNGDLPRGGRITTLDGLAHLPNLVDLDLSGNDVGELSGLAQAPQLTRLTLTNNAVRDLGPLAGLTSLQDLGLSGNEVTDLAPLAGLTQLRFLGLSRNAVTDLGPLAPLAALTELDVSNNQVADVTPLAALSQLDKLRLGRDLITDPSALQALPALTTLDVSGNRIRDAATLAGCRAVEELSIGGNPLTDVGPLRDMPALKGVDLSESDSTRLAGIEALRAKGIFVGGLA